eukprot:scaffold43453_cov75-Phaeocystis_antarctica.AAC.8
MDPRTSRERRARRGARAANSARGTALICAAAGRGDRHTRHPHGPQAQPHVPQQGRARRPTRAHVCVLGSLGPGPCAPVRSLPCAAVGRHAQLTSPRRGKAHAPPDFRTSGGPLASSITISSPDHIHETTITKAGRAHAHPAPSK